MVSHGVREPFCLLIGLDFFPVTFFLEFLGVSFGLPTFFNQFVPEKYELDIIGAKLVLGAESSIGENWNKKQAHVRAVLCL